MTHRNRQLLDCAHDAPCFLNLCRPCGQDPSVPCHSDLLKHGRGVGHKSPDWAAVPGCPACHRLFTRGNLGRERYEAVWLEAFERYQTWLWTEGKICVDKQGRRAA